VKSRIIDVTKATLLKEPGDVWRTKCVITAYSLPDWRCAVCEPSDRRRYALGVVPVARSNARSKDRCVLNAASRAMTTIGSWVVRRRFCACWIRRRRK